MDKDLKELIYRKEELLDEMAVLRLRCEEREQNIAMYLAQNEADKIRIKKDVEELEGIEKILGV